MKLAYLVSGSAIAAVAFAADNTTITTCQESCSESSIASNSTCGSTYTECACDNTFVQAVKVCLYQDSCSSDVSTWFDVATELCEDNGGTANYSSTHSSNYTWSSDSSSAASTATSDAAASTSSAATTSASSSTSSTSNAYSLSAIGGGAVSVVGAVVGGLLLL